MEYYLSLLWNEQITQISKSLILIPNNELLWAALIIRCIRIQKKIFLYHNHFPAWVGNILVTNKKCISVEGNIFLKPLKSKFILWLCMSQYPFLIISSGNRIIRAFWCLLDVNPRKAEKQRGWDAGEVDLHGNAETGLVESLGRTVALGGEREEKW